MVLLRILPQSPAVSCSSQLFDYICETIKFQLKMRFLFLLSILLIPFLASSQTTTNPDTVCYQTSGSTYSVTSDPGVTYSWAVSSPGSLTSGQGTNSIVVDWSAASPGLIPHGIQVTVTNGSGCDTTVNIDVFILRIVPAFSAQASCLDGSCIPLNGTPIGGVFTGPGVTGLYQFCPSLAGVGNHTLTYTYLYGGCIFSTNGSGPFIVNALPNISLIQHN